MSILVCPLSRVPNVVKARAPSRVVSLLDPDTRFPDIGPAYIDKHLRVSVHDILDEQEGFLAPQQSHVDDLLGFLQSWERDAPILIHCYAGISRSTATAFITACLHNPDTDERIIANALRQASPSATPNRRLVMLADRAMGRKGRMLYAIESIGRGGTWLEIGEAEPFEMASQFK